MRNVEDLESVKNFKVETLEIAGLHSVLEALHLPFGGKNKSHTYENHSLVEEDGVKVFMNSTRCAISEKDKNLIHALINNGDEHGKCIRGFIVYAKITAPRYWWSEADTYRIGTERLASNSTMHQQGKGLDTFDLVTMKEALPESTMQTRVQWFSYQTLRRIYFQRRNHRLPQWHTFCDWIETLPFAEEFITFEK